MNLKHLFLIPTILFIYDSHAATKCSTANLTRCLDSVCAINVSSNPAARCQYCGTSNAGTPPKSKMRSVSAGASAKYNISEKELKKAPEDPGQRYAWATTQCIKKVAGCSADDVSEAYDKLIEQSEIIVKTLITKYNVDIIAIGSILPRAQLRLPLRRNNNE